MSEEERTPQEAQPSGEASKDQSPVADLKDFLHKLDPQYEEVQLPSKGLLYEGALPNGIIHVKPMTMREEKLLATPRLIRSGKAINMIFESCMREDFPAEDLLSVDRTFLLIWLRGISYGVDYTVQIKCPSCSNSFPEEVNLSELPVEYAPEDLIEPIEDTLPDVGVKFKYRFSRGKDESAISRYRDRKTRDYGDEAYDDTMLKRDATLIEEIHEFSSKAEIQAILERISMKDATYLRGCFSDPGFGVNTKIPLVCPYCSNDFDVDLPVDANFFFPRRTKNRS